MLPMIPMPMPKMPMPMPPAEKQDRQGTCPNDSLVFGKCPEDKKENGTSTPASFGGLLGDFKDALSGIFGKNSSQENPAISGTGNNFADQLKAIANSPNPNSDANKGLKAYVTAQKETGTTPLSATQFTALRVAAEADPQGFAEQVHTKFAGVEGINDLLPAGGSLMEGSAGFNNTDGSTFVERVSNTISNWIRGWFGL